MFIVFFLDILSRCTPIEFYKISFVQEKKYTNDLCPLKLCYSTCSFCRVTVGGLLSPYNTPKLKKLQGGTTTVHIEQFRSHTATASSFPIIPFHTCGPTMPVRFSCALFKLDRTLNHNDRNHLFRWDRPKILLCMNSYWSDIDAYLVKAHYLGANASGQCDNAYFSRQMWFDWVPIGIRPTYFFVQLKLWTSWTTWMVSIMVPSPQNKKTELD